ncbi:MAG: SIS domain-containing protein [Acidimicrobiales bacterium]|nr:SIS domain-containing protein [Acidimicrobiales bacterium]
MCGIIGVVRRPATRATPRPDEILDPLGAAVAELAALPGDPGDALEPLVRAAGGLEIADRLLRGAPGVTALLRHRSLGAEAGALLDTASDHLGAFESLLDAGAAGLAAERLEQVNAAVIRVKDAAWAIRRDRLPTAEKVRGLAGPDAGPAAVEAFLSVQQALSALDRLEVRGRDSAGLHLLVSGHGLDLGAPAIAPLLGEREGDHLFESLAVRAAEGGDGTPVLSFVYKAAAEIGELGDNTAALRAAIEGDALLHLALAGDDARALVLGHTRWASVGIISEANAHPLNSDEQPDDRDAAGAGPYVTAALNGDVDNFADLKAAHGLALAPEITTDAKVIPTLVSRRVSAGESLDSAFRAAVASMEGSVAIGASSAAAPDRLHLALRGSGQALYVGLAEDLYIVASEPYGVVEETDTYLRMDGETPANADNPTASRGQIVVLDGARAGTVEGIERQAYDGTPLPVVEADLAHAQITTRDIDRGSFAHFLLKEITEAPTSFRKTLRGKLRDEAGALAVVLGPDTLPDDLRADLAAGRITRVVVTGQGTAAVAGESLAVALADALAGTPVRVEAVLATELSGFAMRPDMSDTLVVAISQSGTTTDTNRTVDVVRARGARVVAIVNRRNSDLTDKVDGVLYTSDGRDVEMSVASTKAFYAQIAAGFLLTVALSDAFGVEPASDRQALLTALRDLPEALEATIATRPAIAQAAQQLAPQRRYWAIVGNGANRVAAREIRIKLSELCYKSIACDSTEDKKHIDLSSEPLILVCAAGLEGSNADDVAKEVAIYRAHKAAPVVIATEGEGRFASALHALSVPATHPRLAFVLAAMAGHLFGYEAALAIDGLAQPLREARAAIEGTVAHGLAPAGAERLLEGLQPTLSPLAGQFFDGLRGGEYDGHLEASTAVRVASMLRYALGVTPLDLYQVENGKVGTPAVVVEDLTAALGRAIEELTRPIDAIKHQAKTVTVGISRTDETLLAAPLVRAVLDAGAARDRLSYRSLRTLADLDPAVVEVTGFTRYRIDGPVESGDATSVVVDRGGIARELPSRTERDPALRGTKNRVATDREVLVAKGRRDGRTLVIVPEIKDNQATGLTLLHVRFADRLPVATIRAVLQGYRGRFAALRDSVTETEPTFREDLLGDLDVVTLLTEPVTDLAERWRANGAG